MISAIVWGLVQGLTEFLPVSSSGHLVLVPAFLTELGMDLAEPSLEVSAVLHLGTLLAVLVYFRSDLVKLFRVRTDFESPILWKLIIIGTIPALIGLPLEGSLERMQDSPKLVGAALIGSGLVLLVGSRLASGSRRLEQAGARDAWIVGLAQALALIPGVSRSGTTITAGLVRDLKGAEAARYSFLLGIPTIAGGGLKELLEMSVDSSVATSLLVGMSVAALSGYGAIALLLAALRRVGLLPFALYALLAGTGAVLFL